MTELAPEPDRPTWRAGACARTPADEKVSLPRELERQKRALEQAYRDLARKVQTVEKRAKQLAKARAALQTACLKTRSLADLSHEIRTPMTAILGYVDLLGAPGTSEAERRKYLETIRRNGEHLLRVLDNVLDLSKIGAGKMPLERKACSPVQLMGGESSADAAAEDATPPAVDRDFVLRGRILLAEDTPGGPSHRRRPASAEAPRLVGANLPPSRASPESFVKCPGIATDEPPGQPVAR